MKRILAFCFFLCIATISIVANNAIRGRVIDLTCTNLDPTHTPITRAPQIMPCISVEGNTLFLNNSFFQDIVVEILDDQDNVVFYENVPYGINSIVIPIAVSNGDYQLYIKTSTQIYDGILLME